MIKFIEGSAVFDVSAKMREMLCKTLSETEDKVFLIVPDQFEFETEKAVYSELKNKLLTELSRVNVTTFSSLSRKILADAGNELPAADEAVKSVVMNKAIREQKNRLSVLKGAADKNGFGKRMVDTINALKTAGLTADDLNEKSGLFNADGANGSVSSLVKKLNDVGKIFESYDAMLSKYADNLDCTKKASELISRTDNDFFENACVFVDCFNDFTGQQMEFIRRMIAKAKDIVFAFVVDGKNSERSNIFGRILAQREKIRGYAEKENIEPIIIDEGIDKRLCDTLGELSERIFTNNKSEASPNGFCELVNAGDIYDEADYTAAKIQQLCLDEGMLYREIAVLCADAEYGKYIRDAFEKYNIPFFLDIPESILYQPLVSFFISLLNVLRNFTADNVLSCLKTGFYYKPNSYGKDGKSAASPISDKDINVFESYIFEWNLSAKHLKEEFRFETDDNDYDQAQAETVRKAVVEPILQLRKEMTDKDGAEITRLLYDFAANKVGIERAINAHCKKGNTEKYRSTETGKQIRRLRLLKGMTQEQLAKEIGVDSDAVANYEQGISFPGEEKLKGLVKALDCTPNALLSENVDAVRVNRQIWGSLVEILEVLEGELSGEKISLDEYYRLFKELCANTTLAKPPQFRDCVLIGDIDRTRVGGVKAAFIVGASYEKLPALSGGMGIFSEYEAGLVTNMIRKSTASDDIRSQSLKDFMEQYSLSLYRAYRAVSLPTEYLSISCPEFDASGNKLSRSTVFSDVKRVFPNIEIIKTDDLTDEFYCRSVKAVKQRYSASLDSDAVFFRAMRTYLEDNNNKDFVKKLDEIHNSRINKIVPEHKLSEAAAKRLFTLSLDNNGQLSVGATTIEKLLACPFMFFCLRELGINDITKREFNRINLGNARHFVMESVFNEYKNNFGEFLKLKPEQFTQLSEKYLVKYLEKNTNGDIEDDSRTAFLFKNIASSATDLLVTMQTELSVKTYCPQVFEHNLSKDKKIDVSIDINEFNGSLLSDDGEKTAGGENQFNFELKSEPLKIKLSDGTEVNIGGNIDRLDIMYAEKDGKPRLYLRIIDYKSSAKTFDMDNAKIGANIQKLLYLNALCDANSDNESIDVLPGEISYIPSKNAGAPQAKLNLFYLLEMTHHPNGLYIKDDIIMKNLDKVTEKIAEKIAGNDGDQKKSIEEEIKATFIPDPDKIPDHDQFKAFSKACTDNVRNKLEKIYSEAASADPLIYSEKTISLATSGKTAGTIEAKDDEKIPCKYCEYSGFCGNSQKKEK